MIQERAFKPGDRVVGRKMGHPFAPQEARLIATIDARDAEIERLREALVEAESCMSIVEPRSDKAEYLRILGVVRAALKEARHD